MDQQVETDAIRVARNAADVLENEAYVKAMEAMKAQIAEQWKASPIRDSEGQLLLLQLAKMADMFDGILAGYIQAGKLAQHRINLEKLRNENMAQRVMRRTFSKQ